MGQLDSESDREVDSPRRLRETGPCGRGLFAASVISLGVYVAPSVRHRVRRYSSTLGNVSRARGVQAWNRTEAHSRNRVTFASASMM